MPFWTKFWVYVPPVVFFILGLLLYFVGKGKEER